MVASISIKEIARDLARKWGINYDTLKKSEKNTLYISAILLYLDKRTEMADRLDIEEIDMSEIETKGIMFN